jgi:hypothetical protein
VGGLRPKGWCIVDHAANDRRMSALPLGQATWAIVPRDVLRFRFQSLCPASVRPLSRERRAPCYRIRPSRARRSSAAAPWDAANYRRRIAKR